MIVATTRTSARFPLLAVLLAAALGPLPAAAAQDSGVESMATAPFPNFESGPVHALRLSPDGKQLFVLNTPDHRVEIWDTNIGRDGVPQLHYAGAVFTGLEPVSMTWHPNRPHTLFVANLLSDSVSVVDTLNRVVTHTIDVGDEPQDVLVVGDRLFTATARSAEALTFTEPGSFIENAVVIASAAPPYAVLQRVAVPGHKPRALAEADGAVWVIPQNSGNHTTVLDVVQTTALGLDQLALDAFDLPFAPNPVLTLPVLSTLPWLNQNFGVFGWAIPQTSRIVFDSEYPALVPQLQDRDVIGLDPVTGALLPSLSSGAGSTLLALERNPATGALWVAAQGARNRTRFEPVLSGAAFDNAIAILTPGGSVSQRLLLAPPTTAAQHAQPTAIAFSSGTPGPAGARGAAGLGTPIGPRAFVACLGDDSLLVLDALSGQVLQELSVGSLPSGLAVDDAHGLLYVFSRGDKRVVAYSLGATLARVGRPAALAVDPEPQGVATGRRHLYDARVETGAGTGNFSCASCHVFGHMDQLAWDLGDPKGSLGYFYNDVMAGVLGFDNAKLAQKTSIMTHPMKGPMTTQSLRGLDTSGATPLHWRGDRRFLQMFRGAFAGLLGGSGIDAGATQEFSSFVRSLTYPPNPHEPKDRVYTGDAATGRDLFGMNPLVPGKEYNNAIPGTVTCISCHKGDFTGGTDFTGSQATVNFDGEGQLFNTAQLRGVYEKEYPELTGFGTLHDGALDDIDEFLNFVPPGSGAAAFPLLTPADRVAVAAFVRGWDTGLSPLVGQQFSADSNDYSGLYDWLDLAEGQALLAVPNVDLIGKTQVLLPGGGRMNMGLRFGFDPASQEFRYQTDTGRWVPRGPIVGAITTGKLLATFTCVPPGMGVRLGIDRDEDGILDGTELGTGTSPDSADSDRDGFADSVELLAGGNPLVPNATLPGDGTAPQFLATAALDVFADTATLHAACDEPATLLVELGTAAGTYTLPPVTDAALRSAHDVILTGLPARTEIFWRITATDRAGNLGSAEGSFTTAPPLYHVSDIALSVSGTGPFTVTGTVSVVDHAGAAVVDAPVRVLWAGDLGGADPFPAMRTNTAGVATFTLGPYTPTAPTTLTLSPTYIGSNANADAYFIGFGGDVPKFFYNQSANAKNAASITLP